ncbi:uncharacterized protein K441DRAFT_145802 [Cenococcum geophilum 1.58]|uniref:uncharacterized protein n=1 Tax=Cenococcum geophilum 1.58 TaxID=794803 RepID=UPI00358FA874|nr:hypothetical protein K441DRAFT_145802 [Cenococcum geophilum 1.58]
MPRARRRGRDNWAGNAVKRDASALTGADPESGYESSDCGEVGTTITTTPTPITTAAPQGSFISKEQKEYDESAEYSSDIRVITTMTLSPTSTATSVASLGEANYPTETVVITVPSPHHSRGISQTTEHLLIAAGSIGATIIVVMIICGIYTMRKRGITFAEVIKRMKPSKYQRQPATPRSRNWTTPAYTLDHKEPFEYGSMKALPTTPPRIVMARAASDSQRTLIPLSRSPSQTPEDDGPRSFLLDSPPRPTRSASHARKPSTTRSSLVLPLQTTRRSASTTRTRSLTVSSDLQYPYQAPEPQDPQPPPPTFRKFLGSRRTSSTPAPRPGPSIGFGDPLVSRFSWTNSQAPQTPARTSNANLNPSPNGVATATTTTTTTTTAAAALPMAAGRESVATARSSLARFRTIDSWVSQQAARVEEQRLRETARPRRGSNLSDGDGNAGVGVGVGMGAEDGVPEVPDLPPNASLLGVPGGVPGGRAAARLQRHDSSATEATVFRQHPGTEVRMSVRSLVPSEILNSKMRPSVL